MIPNVYADSTSICLDSDTHQDIAEIIIDGNTTTIEETKTCPSGCSETLSRCRPNEFNRALLLAGLMAGFLLLTSFLIKRITTVGITGMLLLVIINLLLVSKDIFTGTERTLLLVVGVYMIAMTILLIKDFMYEKKAAVRREDDD